MERVRGIEPPYSAWEADVLPLNYTRRMTKRITGGLVVRGDRLPIAPMPALSTFYL